MDKKLVIASIFMFTLFFAISESYQSFLKNKIIDYKNHKIKTQNKTIKLLEDSIKSINKVELNKKINKFNFVKSRFKSFNPSINDSTVKIFINVSEHFNLDSTEEMFNLFVHEIILESGAKQYEKGKLIKSYAGAIGICQIMPNTAFSFLKRIVDSTEMKTLGCEDFYFVKEDCGMYSPTKSSTKNKTIKWLSNEKNNIALWGAIMRYSLNKNNNNIFYALISYNSGGGGLTSFIKSGLSPNSHSYIKGIFKKEIVSNSLLEKSS